MKLYKKRVTWHEYFVFTQISMRFATCALQSTTAPHWMCIRKITTIPELLLTIENSTEIIVNWKHNNNNDYKKYQCNARISVTNCCLWACSRLNHLHLWTLVTFRTNGAVTRDFEQDVGSRTTHYIFSTNTLMNSMRNYAHSGFRGPPVSKVRSELRGMSLCYWASESPFTAVQQETRYVFLPDHNRDYLLMKAAATHSPVGSGPEKDKE